MLREQEYKQALKRIEYLMDKEDILLTDEDEREIEELSNGIKEYENKHYPIEPPSVMGYLQYIVENRATVPTSFWVDIVGMN